MSGRLRWKKHPRETGLVAVGAGPYRASNLHDGERDYATVYPLGGNWSRKFQGWYWVVPSSVVGEYMNTCDTPVATEQEAKKECEAWLKPRLARKQ